MSIAPAMKVVSGPGDIFIPVIPCSTERLTFSEFPDPALPIEYQHFLLQCDVPRQEPNTYFGTIGVTIAGAQCKIVGRR
jgi:hypothetical protein